MSDDMKRAAARELLATMLDSVRLATDLHEARRCEWVLHGAGRMALRLGVIDIDEWDRLDEVALFHVESLKQSKNGGGK